MRSLVICISFCLLAFSASAQVDMHAGLPPVPDPAKPETNGKVNFLVSESNFGDVEDIDEFSNAGDRIVARYLVGCEDNITYCYTEVDMPSGLLDPDGGEIRLILQHETDSHDQVRTVDLNLGCEWETDAFGDRGRYFGRYCWGRQVGGGEYNFLF